MYHRISNLKKFRLTLSLSAGRWKLYVMTQKPPLQCATLCASNGSFTNRQGYRPLPVSQSLGDRCLHLQSSLEAELLPRVVSSGGRYIRIICNDNVRCCTSTSTSRFSSKIKTRALNWFALVLLGKTIQLAGAGILNSPVSSIDFNLKSTPEQQRTYSGCDIT